MARPGVTYRAVAEAATALSHQGQPPTVDGVWARLGTGSKRRKRSGPSSRYRRRRRADQAQVVQDLKQQLAQAQANLEHYRESVRQQREQERADFERQLRPLEQALKESRAEQKALQAAYGRLEKDQARFQAERDQLQAENASLNKQVGQLYQKLEQTQRQWAEGEGRYQTLPGLSRSDCQGGGSRGRNRRAGEIHGCGARENPNDNRCPQKAENKIEGLQGEKQVLAQEKAAIKGQFKQWQGAL